MKTNKKSCVKLNRAAQKYGFDNFKFEIIARCPFEYVLKLEQWFITNLNPEYNIAKFAGSNLGIKRSTEVKLQRSMIQKKNWLNDEYRQHHLDKLSLNWKLGSNHKGAKIDEAVVIKIKILISQLKTSVEIANELNVGYHTVKDIKRNKTWKHVTL